MTTSSTMRALALTSLLALSGCGGGGGGGYAGGLPVSTTPAASSETQGKLDAFMALMKGMVQTALDTSEPADVTAYDPAPASDVAEPVALP